MESEVGVLLGKKKDVKRFLDRQPRMPLHCFKNKSMASIYFFKIENAFFFKLWIELREK